MVRFINDCCRSDYCYQFSTPSLLQNCTFRTLIVWFCNTSHYSKWSKVFPCPKNLGLSHVICFGQWNTNKLNLGKDFKSLELFGLVSWASAIYPKKMVAQRDPKCNSWQRPETNPQKEVESPSQTQAPRVKNLNVCCCKPSHVLALLYSITTAMANSVTYF